MSIFPGPSNAIVYARFILSGGWRGILTVAGLYGMSIATAIWLATMGASSAARTHDLQEWVRGLIMLQIVWLLVFGTYRVDAAVRGDITSRMIESHRLMPTPALGSILGYLFGATLTPLAMAAVTFMLGAVCCQISGIGLDQWALCNGILLFLAVFLYALIAQFAFIARGGFGIFMIFGLIWLAIAEGQTLTIIIPSVAVLLHPLISLSAVFDPMLGSARMFMSHDIARAYIISLAGQAAIAAIAVRVAIRRYSSAKTIGISPALGLMLLAVWVGLAMVSFISPELFSSYQRYSNYSYTSGELVAQTVGAVVTSLLMAMLPIASAARTARDRKRVSDPSVASHPGDSFEMGTVLAATAIVCLLLLGFLGGNEQQNTVLIQTALIIVIFLTGVACLFSAGYRQNRKAWVYVLIWVTLTWLGPIIADAVYRGMNDNNSNATLITAFSTPGALSLIWSHSLLSIRTGVIGQAMLTVIPAGILFLTWSRQRDRRHKRALHIPA